MRSIFKQVIFDGINQVRDVTTVSLLEFEKILKLDIQKEKVCLWYEVNNMKPPITLTIRCFGTGYIIEESIYEKLDYINSLSFLNDDLIDRKSVV